MRLFWFLFLACAVLLLITIGWPTTPFTLGWLFWFFAAVFAYILDMHYGVIPVAGRRSAPPNQN